MSLGAEPMIDPEAELVHRVHLVFDAEQVLHRGRRSSAAAPARGAPSATGLEPAGRNLVARKRRAAPAAVRVSGSQSGGSPEKSPLRSAAVGTEKVCVCALRIALSFVAEEEERPIRRERPADVDAELILAQRRDRPGRIVEVVVRVERLVAHELERAAVEPVARPTS